MLSIVKTSLRISHDLLDEEIKDLIEAARRDLILSGISSDKANEEEKIDPLIKRAIIIYCKANFGFNSGETDRVTSVNRYQESYNLLKNHLSLAGDYNV
ncbi:head-tail connector protein [Cytobacillus horneckiae]|uniref:head-tail connector protein n=1 Tax=Cytobacillus horneckiae TaxID=549687 RepID=UPI0034CDAE79